MAGGLRTPAAYPGRKRKRGMASLMYTYLLPQQIPSALSGRRFAATKAGRIGVVPRNVQVGDLVVQLAGPLNTLVLRRDPKLRVACSETEIKNALKIPSEVESTKPNRRLDLMAKVDQMAVENCTLVGECYIDGVVGWKLKEKYDCKIYALR